VLKERAKGALGNKPGKAPPVAKILPDADVLLAVAARAREVFHNRDKALRWLREASPALAGRTPLQVIGSPEGQAEVVDLLGQIQHGILA
jgi:putative toxin-antitoxin system antitoxin component (TIGR02293 family)